MLLVSLIMFQVAALMVSPGVQAQTFEEPPVTYARGEVTAIVEENTTEVGGYRETFQEVQVRLQDQQTIQARYVLPLGANDDRLLKVEQQVVIAEQAGSYHVTDLYRLPAVGLIFGLFFVVIVVFSGIRGVTALAGLGFSIWLLLYYLVPRIAEGHDPVLVSLSAALVIAGVALYLAHGFNQRTTVSLISTLLTLVIAVAAAFSFVSLTSLFGLGSEASLELQYGAIGALNLKGLLLAGIIIGALGVLDDITTAQTAAIDELHRANQQLDFGELYQRGMSIGREHITSLVNTLALAYAGASLPMLLLFTVYSQPLWVTINSEFVVEEIVRTIVGSLALALAVPITTALAAYWFGRQPVTTQVSSNKTSHHHH
jgi:uncharacterized membrane protein